DRRVAGRQGVDPRPAQARSGRIGDDHVGSLVGSRFPVADVALVDAGVVIGQVVLGIFDGVGVGLDDDQVVAFAGEGAAEQVDAGVGVDEKAVGRQVAGDGIGECLDQDFGGGGARL